MFTGWGQDLASPLPFPVAVPQLPEAPVPLWSSSAHYRVLPSGLELWGFYHTLWQRVRVGMVTIIS